MASKLSSKGRFWGKDMLSKGVDFHDLRVDNPHPVIKKVKGRMTTNEIEEMLEELENQ